MAEPGGHAPQEMGEGGGPGPVEVWGATEAAKEAEAAAAEADVTATAATKAAATPGAAEAAKDAIAAAKKARKAAKKARKAARKARAAVERRKVTWGSAWPFLKKGLRDFWTNSKRTWLVILVFIVYLPASASVLYEFLGAPAQKSSWLQALYSTWLSMSTAGELTTKSSKLVWALGAANLLVGLLFFGFIVWLVTTSLYQAPDARPGAAKEYLFQLHSSGLTGDERVDAVNWAGTAVGPPVRFNAVRFGESAWYASGPVSVKAREALANTPTGLRDFHGSRACRW